MNGSVLFIQQGSEGFFRTRVNRQGWPVEEFHFVNGWVWTSTVIKETNFLNCRDRVASIIQFNKTKP